MQAIFRLWQSFNPLGMAYFKYKLCLGELLAVETVVKRSPSAARRNRQSAAASVHPRPEDTMNKTAISFGLGASALFATAATAAPLTADQLAVHNSNVLNVRMICNENGRCWRERGERRIRDSYGYDEPRERYIERRGYEERGGIGIRVPGVSVGIGTDRY